jgi:Flp pilus assembly protein TadG
MRCRGDRGSVDAVEMLFLGVGLIALFLFVVELGAYWHAKNVLEEAAASGAQAAAAFDGDCSDGRDVATSFARERGGAWVDTITVTCRAGEVVTLTVGARSPGLVFGTAGFTVAAQASAVEER